MANGRPAIPAAMEREVKIESGYRCAMPTCRETTLDMCHIVPWEKVKVHEAHNLIALCPVDHRRFDRGHIPRTAIFQIKQNQTALSHRYSELEQRILRFFGEQPDEELVPLDWTSTLLYQALIDDKILVPEDPDDREKAVKMSFYDDDDDQTGEPSLSLPIGPRLLRLTTKGRALVTRLFDAEPVD